MKDSPDTETPKVEVVGATKRFGGALALDDVSVTIRQGEIHAIVGENGAGKSTLGRMIAGAVAMDSGEMRLDGDVVQFRQPRDAIKHGISMIDQELAILPERSVSENVFLGSNRSRLGFVTSSGTDQLYKDLAGEFGFELDPRAKAGDLRVAEQQKIEILRALARSAELIVMDEPTAPLSREESKHLHDVMRSLRDAGKTIVFVSHFLEEVLELADTISVLKDGRHIRTAPAANETKDSLIEAMLGRSLDVAFPPKVEKESTQTVLSVSGITSPSGSFEDVSFEVRAGEILGIAGLVGSGRTEIARAIFGADPISTGGHMELDGKPYRPRSPIDGIKAGVALVPEDRKQLGLVMERSVRENLGLAGLRHLTSGGFIRRGREQRCIDDICQRFAIKCASADISVATLSGGNQQKIVLGKWMVRAPKLLIVDEPTRGVDVGAKFAIYEALFELASTGVAIITISSDLEEVLGLADRVLVLARGRLTAEFTEDVEKREAEVLAAAFADDTATGANAPGGMTAVQ